MFRRLKVLTFIVQIFFASASSAESPLSFFCTDGAQIQLSSLCNGIVDCPDSSDEVQKLCRHVVCPKTSYRCDYGACIAKSRRCDGFQDCIDGSDELHCDVSTCSDREYQCFQSLECIPISNTCNGYPDCLDKSDESLTLCKDFPCPAHTYECIYGACVHQEVICDGANDCIDGSDEEPAMCAAINCRGDECQAYTCKNTEFSCTSRGQCIPTTKVCDGTFQCRDGSDEETNLCKNQNCSEGYFECAYGGCIPATLKCNFEPNCHDWSDEDEGLCGVILPEGACRVPPAKPGTYYRVSECPGCRPGSVVPELTRLEFLCDDKHSMEGPSDVFCQGGHWLPYLSSCFSKSQDITCPPLSTPAAKKRCEVLWGSKEGWIPCNGSLPVGTHVVLECPDFYEPASGAAHTTCLHDGTWSQLPLSCRPVCGVKHFNFTTLIVKGWEVPDNEALPWHATLFSHDKGEWKFFCGGTLLSERVVLTAGHCVWKTDPKTLRVVLAGYFSNFTLDEHRPGTQIFGVSSVILQPVYQDHEGNYGSDLAVLILDKPAVMSEEVGPACINWAYTADVATRVGELALISGMGFTENDTFSQTLRVTTVKIISEEECRDNHKKDFRKYLTYTTFCAGWGNGTAVCNGDSGGGLVLPRPNSTVWDVYGVVSISPRRLGMNVCDPQYYTVFTKVPAYHDWIEKILKSVPVVGPEKLDVHPNQDILS